ncbi:hypothetical protein ACQZ46_12900, partial [Agrobacterium salinitolerans]
RETPQRQWYFVSRRGRVGRCQVCKTQLKIFSITLFGPADKKGRYMRPFVIQGKDLKAIKMAYKIRCAP